MSNKKQEKSKSIAYKGSRSTEGYEELIYKQRKKKEAEYLQRQEKWNKIEKKVFNGDH